MELSNGFIELSSIFFYTSIKNALFLLSYVFELISLWKKNHIFSSHKSYEVNLRWNHVCGKCLPIESLFELELLRGRVESCHEGVRTHDAPVNIRWDGRKKSIFWLFVTSFCVNIQTFNQLK